MACGYRWTRKLLRPMSCTGEGRVEGRHRHHHLAHHERRDEQVRVQLKSVLGRTYTSIDNLHRYPHCTCGIHHAPNTGTSTYAQESRCRHTRCDLAPLTTSFGTVGQWERQHLAMTPHIPGRRGVGCQSRLQPSVHLQRNATAYCAACSTVHYLWYNCQCYDGQPLPVADCVEEVHAVTGSQWCRILTVVASAV